MPETNQLVPYYPKLSQIIKPDDLPGVFGFLKDGFENTIQNLHYKNFQSSKSALGEKAHYELDILTKSRIDIGLFGSGIFFILNPDQENGQLTSFPISLSYNWPIVAYLKGFDLAGFDFTPQSFFQLAMSAFRIREDKLIANAMNLFTITEGDKTVTQQFLEDINNQAGTALTIPSEEDEFREVLQVLQNEFGSGLAAIVFKMYLLNVNDLDTTQNNINQFFQNLIPAKNIEAYFRELLLPTFQTTLQLSAGIEFPRSILVPVDINTLEPIPEGDVNDKAIFKFAEANFLVSNNGLTVASELALTSLQPFQIGNTGFILEVDRLKIDLNKKRNIPEADLDGRPADFTGVYADEISVTLPKKWFTDIEGADSVKVGAYNILLGSGGISGTIALEAVKALNVDGTIDHYYTDHFQFDYPIKVKHTNVESSLVEEQTLQNHEEVLAHYNINKVISFVYPLTISKTDGSRVTFKDAYSFNQHLSGLSEDTRPKLIKKLGSSGFEVSFRSFDITFKQGKIINSNIVGGLKIPKLKDADGNIAEIDIVGSFNENGDFRVTASERDGFAPLEINNILKLFIYSLEIGSEDDKIYLGVSSQIALTNPVMTKLFCGEEQRIPLPNMRIYDDGSFEIVGGQIPVPSSFRLCLGPVDISVTGINQGSYQRAYKGELRKYNFWGFDGAISIDPLGIDARGDGIKYYYTVDDDYIDEEGNPQTRERHTYIRVQTIGIDLIIPGNAKPEKAAAIISGYLSIPEPGISNEYAGGVAVSIPKTGLKITADMRLIPKHPAFIIDASISLPTPVPIGSTGLVFTAFRGLIGYRYVAEKEAVGLVSGEDTWYDYYVHPRRGINIDKFSSPEQSSKYKNPVSIGAGATITTAIPGILAVRAMFLLSIPSMFLLDGKGSILAPEIGLDDSQEPPFFAFLAVGDASIEIGMGADLKLPAENGWILSLRVAIEMAFFFKNASAWYINVGTKEKPNEARILNILDGKAFLQISAKGIEAGARVELSINKKFGPVKFKAWLFGEVGGKISFEGFQIGGYLELGGGFEASIFGIVIGASLNALFSIEAPKPFLIIAELRLCVKVKIAFVKVNKCVDLKIKWEKSKELNTDPIRPLAEENIAEFVKAVNMLTGESYDLVKLGEEYTGDISALDDAPILPLDTYIDIKFSKPVIPNAVNDSIGGVSNPPDGFIELIPPEKNVKGGKTIRQEKHSYSIESINLQAWNGSDWVTYNPYDSVTAKENPENTDIPANLKIGHWQKDRKEYDKIRLLANNPFSFTERGEAGTFIPEQLGITASTLFCEGQERTGRTINWLNKSVGQRYYVPSNNPDHYYRKEDLYFQVGGTFNVAFSDRGNVEYGEIAKSRSNFDFAHSLKIENINTISLKFPNDVREVKLKLSSTARGVFFRFYKAILPEDGGLDVNFELLPDGEIYKTSTELYQELIFTSEEPIAKVMIDPETANEELIADLREQIAALFEDSYETSLSDGEVEITIREPKDKDAYDLLVSQLEEARNEGCRMGFAPPRGIGAMQINNTLIVGEDVFADNPDVTPPVATESCATFLHEVNWLSVTDYEYNQHIPGQDAISEDFEAGINAITKVADPILRPETKYMLSFTLQDIVNNGSETGSWQYNFGFQTGKPLGHYHLDNNTKYGCIEVDGQIVHDSVINPDKYPLTSLRNYIDYKRSYPNANGSLLNAKPLFYGSEGGGNELRVFFTRPYVYHMVDSWGAYNGLPAPQASMQIVIKDPIEKVTFSNPPETTEELQEIPRGTAAWTEDLEPRKPGFLKAYENMVSNLGSEGEDKCIVLPGDAIIPKSFARTFKFQNLKPEKMYTAIVNGVYENKTVELHNYVFQTSRYKNFEEQINSYLLSDEAGYSKPALFEIDLAVTTENLNAAYSNVIGQPDAVSKARETQEADLFDRTINGLLKVPALAPAVTTEFNVLRNEGGMVIGILIRNPEPFNDPKIPLDQINDVNKEATLGLGVMNSSSGIDKDYQALYAKDFSQILVMKEGIDITEENLQFKFQYLLWNGSEYARPDGIDSITTENLKIN